MRVATTGTVQNAKTPAAKSGRANLRVNRLSMLFVGSAVLHVVAAYALLRSWDFSGPTPVEQVVAQAETAAVEEVVQVVRLELAVAPASENAIIKLAKAESSVEDDQDKTNKQEAGNADALELKPADGSEPVSGKEKKKESARPQRSARGAIS
jgi:hypothetical protein